MPIQYITTDLNIDSSEDLAQLASDLCRDDSPHLNEWVGESYCVRLGGTGIENSPVEDIELFCDKIESLSAGPKQLWNNCSNRVLDIAFESGNEPNNLASLLPEQLINRISKLKLSIEITIYRTGLYSLEE